MNFKYPVLFAIALLGSLSIIAEEASPKKIRCATVENIQRLEAEDPQFANQRLLDAKYLQDALLQNGQARLGNSVNIIPVVVHVVYRTTAQNISDAQIQSQIDVLNEDFARLNSDTSNTPSFFKSIAGTSSFQFCLAKQDPDGNPTTGIQRRSTTLTSFSTNDNVKRFSSGGLDAWDVNRYFNIWVCNLGNFILGYAEPASGIHTDSYGVVILYDSFGRVGNVSAPYDQGRTTTHEVGHAFGLEHIWGDDSNCSGTDGIMDTPDQEVETYGCPSSYPQFDNCSPSGSGYMFMNYMDYTDDDCMNMFTLGQVNRMELVMTAFYPTLMVSTACEDVTGISDPANKFSFSVYPNPSEGIINLDMYLMENIGSSLNIEVVDLMGRVIRKDLVQQPSGKTHQLDLRDQQSGIYFVTVYNEKYNKTVRIELTR